MCSETEAFKSTYFSPLHESIILDTYSLPIANKRQSSGERKIIPEVTQKGMRTCKKNVRSEPGDMKSSTRTSNLRDKISPYVNQHKEWYKNLNNSRP